MKILIPLLENSGLRSRVSGHFGHAPFFGIYEDKLMIIRNTLEHHGAVSPIDQIAKVLSPDTIFAMGIGQKALKLCEEKGIKVVTGDCETAEEVIRKLPGLSAQHDTCKH